jgi:fumarate hydratase class II
VLSVLAYLAFVFIVIGTIIMAVSQGKFDLKFIVPMMITALVYFVAYFQSRLLYSMCSHKEGAMFRNPPNKKRRY